MRQAIAAVALALGLAASPASAITLTVTDRGLNGVDTRTCDNSFCGTTLWSLASGEVYAATGTIAIDTTLNTMTISLAVATSVLDADPSQGQAAISDGASSLTFTGGTYTTLAIPVTASLNGNGDSVYTIAAGQEGAVAFTSVVAAGAGPGAALSLGAVRVTGQCTILASGGSGLCGISFGPNGTTNFRIPGGAAFGTYDRWVKHTFNIATTPEPGTALLVGLGVGGLALLRRRASRS